MPEWFLVAMIHRGLLYHEAVAWWDHIETRARQGWQGTMVFY